VVPRVTAKDRRAGWKGAGDGLSPCSPAEEPADTSYAHDPHTQNAQDDQAPKETNAGQKGEKPAQAGTDLVCVAQQGVDRNDVGDRREQDGDLDFLERVHLMASCGGRG
jgi:hypothetical protein